MNQSNEQAVLVDDESEKTKTRKKRSCDKWQLVPNYMQLDTSLIEECCCCKLFLRDVKSPLYKISHNILFYYQ